MDSTLAKGLAVLEWLTGEQRPCGVSEVARAFGIARSNAHRTLQTLVACGWARQDGDGGAYRPSLKLFELGTLVEGALELRPLVRAHLAALAAACGETIHLAVLDGAQIVYLDKFDSPLPVAAYSRIGGRAPAACVASGKALLAALDDIDEPALRARLGTLVAHTPNSHVDWSALRADLARTRSRGFAENREEWRQGVCGLGAPVFDARGAPVAAIGMSVPSIRFGRPKVQALAQLLLSAAKDASVALGYRRASDAPDVVTAARSARARTTTSATTITTTTRRRTR
jgi:IclR family KDG regulon transcriptional repressor